MTRSWMMAASIGIGCVAYLPRLPPFWLPAGILALSLLACLWCRWASIALAFGTGFGWATVFGSILLSSLLPAAFEGQELTATGVVEGFPRTSTIAGRPVQRFVLKLHGPLCNAQMQCANGMRRIQLNAYDIAPLAPGELGTVRVRLKRPHGFYNPGLFDYQGWLIAQGIGASGYVTGIDEPFQCCHNIWIDRWRWQCLQALSRQFESLQYGAMISALLLGDRRAMSPDHWQRFIDTGTIHLVVISGLHIGLIATLGYGFGLALVILSAGWFSLHRWPPVCAALAGALYSAAAGFSLPTQRAMLVVAVLMLAKLLRRQTDLSHRLLFALMMCLLLDPLAVIGLSFWLSFSAVAVFAYLLSGRVSIPTQRGRRVMRAAVMPQLWVFIGMLPVLGALTGQWSLVSPLANVVAVPLFSLLIVPLCFVGLLGALAGLRIDYLWYAVDRLLLLFDQWLDLLLSRFSDAVYFLAAPSSFAVALAGCGVLIVLLPGAFKARIWGLLMLAPFVVIRSPVEPGHLAVTVLDVGQGLSLVLQTSNHTAVYDVGPANENFSTAKAVVIPYLRRQGVGVIDALVLSHADSDHAGNWPQLLASFPVRNIYFGEWRADWPAPRAGHDQRCSDQSWQWDGVTFRFFNPGPAFLERSGNNRSCVLMVKAGQQSLLITGDIERDAEIALLKSQQQPLKSTVLIAPHHGSNTSSSWPLIKAVRPEIVVIGNGYRNRFGHPHQAVIHRYQAIDAKIYSSAEHGAVRFELGTSESVNVVAQRALRRHYWF